jgi:hypothetical protein
VPVVPDENHPKMLWGEPTWLFMHTLAEKIKEEDFNAVKKGF